ncbi:MAG: NfeD family protein [Clostridium sp.]
MAAVIFWLIVAIGVFALDVITSSFLFVWFSIGAFGAIIAQFLGASFLMQVVVFGIVSLISIAIGYPWAKKKFKKGQVKTPLMEETYIGRTFIANEDILEEGRAKVGGVYWTVTNVGDKVLKGEKFQIVGIDGNKFLIKGKGVE